MASKITLYSDYDLKGDTREFTSGQTDLAAFAATASSCKVEGTWILYSSADYGTGTTASALTTGDYATPDAMKLPNDSLRSLRPLDGSGVFLFETPNFGGTMRTIEADTPNVGAFNDLTSSIVVASDVWEFFEDVDYGKKQWTLGPGGYPSPAAGGFPDDLISSVRRSSPSASAVAPPALKTSDLAARIPLRSNTTHQYTLLLTGSAIAGTDPYPIHFDTGSWTTSIPESKIDSTKVRTIIESVDDGWENNCRLVEGQLSVWNDDHTVSYTLENYRFYSIKTSSAKQVAIMGAFPSANSDTDRPDPFPYLLAKQYSAANSLGFGFGIVSDLATDPSRDLVAGWKDLRSYLVLGSDPLVTNGVKWRSDTAEWRGTGIGFCPEAVKSFDVSVSFPRIGDAAAPADISVTGQMATIDTGAPDLTLRLGSDDPQAKDAYQPYFSSSGPTWWNDSDRYKDTASALKNGTVTITYTDDARQTISYSFRVASAAADSPATLFAGPWDKKIPWDPAVSTQPKNRINLGNSVYYYCSVVFYDILNKRVGLRRR